MVHLTEEGRQECSFFGTIKLDTHEVHLQKKIAKNGHLLNIIKLDTHMVHLQKRVVKDESSLLKLLR